VARWIAATACGWFRASQAATPGTQVAAVRDIALVAQAGLSSGRARAVPPSRAVSPLGGAGPLNRSPGATA